jgi:hypothetical protein
VAVEPVTSIETADVLAVDAEVQRSTGAGTYGITETGFVPKPYARLLAEKLALARLLLGEDLDLRAGSLVRKLCELQALEDARTWAALSTMYDDAFVVTASGAALSALGAELGLERPHLAALGRVKLRLTGTPPADPVVIPRGARMLSVGGHHVATEESVALSGAQTERDVAVAAFFPGAEHNLDPAADPGEVIDRFHPEDAKLTELFAAIAASASGEPFDVEIQHTEPLTGGELLWPDERYRELLLRAPRSLWTVDALQTAVSLVPGVRQVVVRDAWGGLDVTQSIFGNFNFIERLFAGERDLGSPYYVTVLVAPTPAAIMDGPDGLRLAVEAAMEDLRPLSIFPDVVEAQQVGIGVQADIAVRGLPLPSGSVDTVNKSSGAQALKDRLLDRLRRYVEALALGEPVRVSEVVWALMSEPGLTDAQDVKLLRYPAAFADLDLGAGIPEGTQILACGENAELGADEIAVLIDDPSLLQIV